MNGDETALGDPYLSSETALRGSFRPSPTSEEHHGICKAGQREQDLRLRRRSWYVESGQPGKPEAVDHHQGEVPGLPQLVLRAVLQSRDRGRLAAGEDRH